MALDDPFAADLLAHLADEMTGPMAAAARVDALALDDAGLVTLVAPLREAAIFLALREDLGSSPVQVRARLTSPEPARDLTPLRFASWSEHGSVLALHTPAADPATEIIGPCTIQLRVFRDGTELDAQQRRALVEARLVSGRLGRLLHVLNAESVAIRRHARAITSARSIEAAEGEALDRHGRDLGVQRFANGLRLLDDGTIRTRPGTETDAAYRRRLALFAAFSYPRRERYAALLGPHGPLAAMGFAGRLSLVEDDNPFSVAIQILSVAPTEPEAQQLRARFHDYLRDWILVDPTKPLPVDRRMTTAQRTAETQLRERIDAGVDFEGASTAMALELALALDRAAALFRALGLARKIRVVRAFDPDQGSRFSLGLGLEIRPVLPADLATAQAAAHGAAPEDRQVRATFSALQPPAQPDDDPIGAWLFAACGFRTVHRLSADGIYVSHYTTSGLAIAGNSTLAMPAGPVEVAYSARFVPQGGEAVSALLMTAVATVASAFPGAEQPPDAGAFLADAEQPTVAEETRLRAAAMPAVTDWGPIRAQLPSLSREMWTVLILPAPVATQLRNGQAGAWRDLATLGESLRAHGLAAVAPVLASGGRFALLVSVTSLPIIGANLAGKAATGFRWFATPIDRLVTPGSTQSVASELTHTTGATTRLRVSRAGLYALVVLGYERRGGTDPFEFRVESAPGDRLDFEQYEFLMNLLALRSPAGVEINTWPIRRFHVMSESGTQTPLDPSASRTFRPFHRPRRAGARHVPDHS